MRVTNERLSLAPTTQSTAAQVERARRLLAHEGPAVESAEERAQAAARVYDKLGQRLTPLLGVAGVQALFLRSGTLARRELTPPIDDAIMESSQRLVDSLRRLEPAAAAATAELLFGNLLALMTTFIGERLTDEAIHGTWPTLHEPAAMESQ